jgi:hypothetical protein
VKISDKAEETPEISLVRQSAPGAYVFVEDELTSAEDLTDEDQFPEYGDFLPVRRAQATDGGHEASGDTEWIQCPQDFAQWLVEHGLEPGDGFRIKSVQKVDGQWQYDCELLG